MSATGSSNVKMASPPPTKDVKTPASSSPAKDVKTPASSSPTKDVKTPASSSNAKTSSSPTKDVKTPAPIAAARTAFDVGAPVANIPSGAAIRPEDFKNAKTAAAVLPPIIPVVVGVKIRRDKPLPKFIQDVNGKIFGEGLREPPLRGSRVSLELKGVPLAYANGIRRAVGDEMTGKHLRVVPPEGAAGEADKTAPPDPFLYDEFVANRIALVPLRVQIPPNIIEKLRLSLYMENKTAIATQVFTGDLSVDAPANFNELLFNPTIPLFAIQPGYSVRVKNIRIVQGVGREDGLFTTAHLTSIRHVDVPQAPRSETHSIGAPLADKSGYLVPPTLAEPRHFVVEMSAAAVGLDPNEARSLLTDACGNILQRLRAVAAGVGAGAGAGAADASRLVRMDLANGMESGSLEMPNETFTLSNIIARTIYEMEPDIAYVSPLVITHEKKAQVVIRAEADIAGIVTRALRKAIDVFTKISEMI